MIDSKRIFFAILIATLCFKASLAHAVPLLGADFLRAHSAYIDVGNKTLYLLPANISHKTAQIKQVDTALLQQQYKKIPIIETLAKN